MSKVFFFKEFGTHSFNFINLDKDSFRFIQLHSSSSFNSLLQNILHYCAACRIWAMNMHNFPQYSVIQQRKNTDGKRNYKKVAPNKPELTLLLVFYFFFSFSSSKSLSTPDFFLMVIKNTLMVSQRHSLDLE